MRKLALLLIVLPPTLAAETNTAEELMAVVLQEQQAFKSGDCEALESMLDPDITFYANGRRMSRDQVAEFCRSIPRPFGDGRLPTEDVITPHVISEDLGYTVRDFRWTNANGQGMHEVVTKIWQRVDGVWTMIHFQSTVLPG